MLRIIFMGTPVFAVPCLDKLVEDGHELLAVVTQPDRPRGRGQKLYPSPVKQAAMKYGLNVLQPSSIKDTACIETLTGLKPDVIVVVAFGQFLPKALLQLPRLGCINVHASLLPKYRGAAPIHWAVINGEALTGVTTMYMDVGMDTGDMILKNEIEIGPNDTTGMVHDTLMLRGADLLSETLRQIMAGVAPRTPQAQQAATYAPLLTRDVERIDWSQSAQVIHNQIRGLNPWPGAYCLHQNKILKLCESRVYETETKNKNPGRIAMHTANSVIVETGTGMIELMELQPECRKRMNARDCANGYCLTEGEILY